MFLCRGGEGKETRASWVSTCCVAGTCKVVLSEWTCSPQQTSEAWLSLVSRWETDTANPMASPAPPSSKWETQTSRPDTLLFYHIRFASFENENRSQKTKDMDTSNHGVQKTLGLRFSLDSPKSFCMTAPPEKDGPWLPDKMQDVQLNLHSR